MSTPANKITHETAHAPEPERYEFREAPIHHFGLDRRDFFKFFGAGIMVFAAANDALALQESGGGTRQNHSDELPKEITAWLHIAEDGKVTAFTGKVEMGQNIRTSLAQSVADELRVPFESVRMVMGDTQLTPFDVGTFGSRTTPTMAPRLRRVASAARDLLLQTAAKEWNIAPEKLVAANATITDPASGRSASYGELAYGKTLAQNLPDADPVTPPSEWTIAGKSLPKVDGRAFVTGRHQYTSDLCPAGLMYGKVLRPPSFGATMTACDITAAQKLPAAVVVHDGEFVAAAAPSENEAEEAIAAIRAQWKETPQPSSSELFSYLKQNVDTSDRGDLTQSGSVQDGLARAAHRVDATYTVAYIAHAPLEPRAAVAEWKMASSRSGRARSARSPRVTISPKPSISPKKTFASSCPIPARPTAANTRPTPLSKRPGSRAPPASP